MAPVSASKTESFSILISKDRLQVWVCTPSGRAAGRAPPQVDDVIRALESAKVQVNAAVRARVEQYTALVAGGADDKPESGVPEAPERFLVAEGVPPTEPESARFQWYEQFAPPGPGSAQDDGPVDYFSLHCIKTVAAGVAVGRLTPAAEGMPGLDVFGRAVPPQRRRGTDLSLGAGLLLSADGREVVTERAGQVVQGPSGLRLVDALDIRGDVNFGTGSLDVCVNVQVAGTVCANFRVRTTESLTVGKAVEAARVEVGRDVAVGGGICGGDAEDPTMGRIRAGGSLQARFCNEVFVTVGGDIRVDREILNCQVRCGAHLVCPRGTIIGGHVWAREGMEVAVLGSDAGVHTCVAVGARPTTLRRGKQMEKAGRERRKAAGQIRERIQPLLANLKRLTPQQREAATELMSKAEDWETEAETLQAERVKLLAQARPTGTASIVVHNAIHPGVRIIWEAREIRIDRLIHGPVRIEERKLDGATELVYVNQRTGSVTVLPSTEVDWDALPADEPEPAGDGNETQSTAGVDAPA